MSKKKLVLIGGGNMGSALLKGILKAGLSEPDALHVVDVHPDRVREIRELYEVAATTEAREAVEEAETVVLSVKPQNLLEVLDEIRHAAHPEQLFLSIVAGIRTSHIAERLGKPNPVIRAMPNIAATVDASATAIAAGPGVQESHMQIAEAIFAAVGEVVRVNEKQMDAVTGLSGSGPAYIYMVIEALVDGGVKMGLARSVALKLATQTVLGSAKLVKETGHHPAILKDQVTTPGGTTIAAIHELEERGLRTMLMSAVVTATQRSKELDAFCDGD